jgi:hypothetical protein
VLAATTPGRRRTTSSTSSNSSLKLRERILPANCSSPSAALSAKARMLGRSSNCLQASRSERARFWIDSAASSLRWST